MDTYQGACGPDAGPLASCLVGVWLPQVPPSCSSSGCVPDAGPPECGEADCQWVSYDFLEGDGGRWTGTYVHSVNMMTFSSRFPARFSGYALADGGIDSEPSGTFTTESCSGTERVSDGYADYSRAGAALSSELATLIADGGNWVALPYPQ
jgi:hypothetical protein